MAKEDGCTGIEAYFFYQPAELHISFCSEDIFLILIVSSAGCLNLPKCSQQKFI